jgi:hypothetical protein
MFKFGDMSPLCIAEGPSNRSRESLSFRGSFHNVNKLCRVPSWWFADTLTVKLVALPGGTHEA